jgi:hypothetical protein
VFTLLQMRLCLATRCKADGGTCKSTGNLMLEEINNELELVSWREDKLSICNLIPSTPRS